MDRKERRGTVGKEIKTMISRSKAYVFVFLDTKSDRFGLGVDITTVPKNSPQRFLMAELYAKLKHSATEMNLQIDTYDRVKKLATEKARMSGRPFADVFKELSEQFAEDAKKGNIANEAALADVANKMATPAGKAIAAALKGASVGPVNSADINDGFVPVSPEVVNADGADKEPA